MTKGLIAIAVAATVAAATAGVAQQTPGGHQGHHGGAATTIPPQAQSSAAPETKAQPPGMMGGGMMQGGGMASGGMMPGGGMMQGGGMMCGMMPGMMNRGAGHQMGARAKGDRSVASLALEAVNAKMHEDMNITMTGDADRDFATSMIAHHQGAIDMAKVVLAFGKDAEVKKLAERIIADQEKEVTWMREWLDKTKK